MDKPRGSTKATQQKDTQSDNKNKNCNTHKHTKITRIGITKGSERKMIKIKQIKMRIKRQFTQKTHLTPLKSVLVLSRATICYSAVFYENRSSQVVYCSH